MREVLEKVLVALPGSDVLPSDGPWRAAERLSDRLQRDLLPRLSGSTPTLIVGIAGPNNVGKSSLFNSLLGRVLSPSRPEGGLTKQCLAAADPSLWAGPLRPLLEERYSIVEVADDEVPPITEPGPPGRLYLVLTTAVPPGVLLMDTPDFDSVHQTNRRAAEALLVTVDLVLFLVSRHTYQNAAVVAFLREVVGSGRPYALVYNEAVREEVARSHLDKLIEDVGHAPVAQEIARHQPEVDAGRQLLTTAPAAGNVPLRKLLRDPAEVARLKARALAASLSDAILEIDEVAEALEASVGEPDRLRARIRRELRQVAERAAGFAVPADVLIEAFRDELDARSPTHKWIRKGPRLIVTGLTRATRFVKDRFVGPDPAIPPPSVRVNESLFEGVREVVEGLAPEVRAWRGDPETAELLRQTLGPKTLEALHAAPEKIVLSEEDAHADRVRLYRFCRELLAEKMPRGAGEQLRQLGATAAYAAPAFVGAVGAVTIPGVTGGADVVFASALITTPVLERFVDLLGAGVRDAVSQSWRTSHGQSLLRELETGPFEPLLTRLDERVEDARRRADVLRQSALSLRGIVHGQQPAESHP